MNAHRNSSPSSVSHSGVATELRIIPGWAYLLAGIVYVALQALFHAFLWPSESNPPPVAFRIAFPLFISMIPAFLVLLVGYVNGDAGRRGMSRLFWTLVVIFVPSAMGFILYFVLRQPVQGGCPGCGTAVDAQANYCPRCRHSFRPTCAVCKAGVFPGDRYCARCGAELAEVA